ncbi:MAG: NADPH-dependent F420 reductase [Anaerolineales bacterium]|nr:NADPH-dependent F420 reductase [Anaerolineales bacterium]
MSEKMILTLAIIGGTGKLGPGLAMRWAGAGYRVVIGSRKAKKAQRIAAELNEALGIETIVGLENAEAASLADICILTVKANAHEAIVDQLKGIVNGKIVVDTTARVDFKNPQPPAPPAAARLAQERLGSEARVVAAFQTVPAHRLRDDLDQAPDLDVIVCSDDQEAAQEVIKLAEGAGMRAYYAGELDNAITLEGISALLISLNKHHDAKTATFTVSGLNTG